MHQITWKFKPKMQNFNRVLDLDWIASEKKIEQFNFFHNCDT